MRLAYRAEIGAGALARDLLAVQQRAYAVEADLIGDDRIPALRETVNDLVAANLQWWLAFEGSGGTGNECAVGAVGFTAGAGVDIDRLIVDPSVFRRGVGRALVDRVVSIAADRPVEVSTGAANAPARRLYESVGFRFVGEIEPVAGLRVSRYRYRAGPRSTMAATGPPSSGP